MFSNILLNKCLSIYKKYKNNIYFIFLLKIASYVFFVLYKTRILLYKLNILKSISLPSYVISIGNLTSGGTGKTSLTIEIAKYFISSGFKVAVLSRGYNTKSENKVTLVSDGTEILTDYDTSGDEAYLIAKKVPKAIVLSGKNRINTGRTAIRLGAEVLILDDGFQYLKLKRNENILILDSYKPFDNGHLLPHGKLRELPDSIKRATAIILSNSNSYKTNDSDFYKIKTYSSGKPIGKFYYLLNELVALNTKRTLSIKEVKGMKVIAVCGIGNPDSFLDLLRRNEINISNHLIYPDHYNYKITDMQEIIKLALKDKIEDIITTEKDAIKIESLCESAPTTFWTTKTEVMWDSYSTLEAILSKIDKTSKISNL